MADGFKFYKNLLGLPTPESEKIIQADSVTVFVGGLVKMATTGFCEDVAVNEGIYGLCEGFVTKDGTPLERAESSEYGTFTDGVWGVKSHLSASDNTTADQVKCVVRPLSIYDVLQNTPDAAIGTTAYSELRGYFTNIITSVQVDENTVSATMGTLSLTIHGVHPHTSTIGLYRPRLLQNLLNLA